MADAKNKALWHGRFTHAPSSELMDFTASIDIDRRLAPEDIEGSRAHVRMLGKTKILDGKEVAAILAALDTTQAEIEAETFVWVESDEDIHTAIERRVTEIAGAAGAKIHTGRSRNDQVATDLHLWFRRAARAAIIATHELQKTLLDQAQKAGDEIY